MDICKEKLYRLLRYGRKNDGGWGDDCAEHPNRDLCPGIPDDGDVEFLAEVAANYDALRAQVSALQTEVDSLKGDLAATEKHWKETDDRCGKLQTEVKHWKDQHANEVKRAYVLKGDAEIHQVRAYELMGELQGQVERMKKYREAVFDALVEYQQAPTTGDAKGDVKRLLASAESERDQLRAEVERLKERDEMLEDMLEALGVSPDKWFRGYTALDELQESVSTSYKKGAESMRERAATVCSNMAMELCMAKDRFPDVADSLDKRAAGAENCASAIRALPLKEDK